MKGKLWILAIVVAIAVFFLWQYGEGQFLAPLRVRYVCPEGICIRTDSPYLNVSPYAGPRGTDYKIYVGWFNTNLLDVSRAADYVEDEYAIFQSEMDAAGVGLGSPCRVKVTINAATKWISGSSAYYYDGYQDLANMVINANAGGGMGSKFYPTDYAPGTWLEGTIVANPNTAEATRYDNYIWTTRQSDGDKKMFVYRAPYVCRTNYNFPAITTSITSRDPIPQYFVVTINTDPARYGLTNDITGIDTSKVERIVGLVFNTDVQILKSSSCITRDTLGGYIDQWIAGTITRDALGTYIMNWVNC